MIRGDRAALPMVALAMLAACAANSPSAPLAGWNRAPDLSVYAAMEMYGGVAREQALLCGGFSPASVQAHWADDYGAREAAVEAALAARHGADALARAEAEPIRQVQCGDIIDLRWRHNYARMLRLLEMRLGLA